MSGQSKLPTKLMKKTMKKSIILLLAITSMCACESKEVQETAEMESEIENSVMEQSDQESVDSQLEQLEKSVEELETATQKTTSDIDSLLKGI